MSDNDDIWNEYDYDTEYYDEEEDEIERKKKDKECKECEYMKCDDCYSNICVKCFTPLEI